MAFGGDTIQWDETVPADGRNSGLGAGDLRSKCTAVRTAIDSEHVFPSTGGLAGYHRIGSARAFHGLQSLVSSQGTDGRMMIASNTSRLFHVGSGGTCLLGAGPGALSIASHPDGAAPQRSVWVEEIGSVAQATGADIITFPNSGFSGKPYVFASAETTTDTKGVAFSVTALSKTGCVINSFTGNNVSASGHTLFWRSLGTRVL